MLLPAWYETILVSTPPPFPSAECDACPSVFRGVGPAYNHGGLGLHFILCLAKKAGATVDMGREPPPVFHICLMKTVV